MNLRWLGRFAMLGAPFLCVDLLMNGIGDGYDKSAVSGLNGLLFISGWMWSIIGLWEKEAAGNNPWGRLVLLIQLLFLSLANCSNILVLLQIGVHTRLFFVLDLFWPVSNIWMLVTGIMVLAAKRLQGWMQVIPLLAALWLPVSVFLFGVIMGGTQQSMVLSGIYAAAAWMLLGYVVYKQSAPAPASPAYAFS